MLKQLLLGGAFVAFTSVTASAAESSGRYRVLVGSGGGNAQPHYRYVRVEAGATRTDAPYALTGRAAERPVRYRTATTQGGNTRFQLMVPRRD